MYNEKYLVIIEYPFMRKIICDKVMCYDDAKNMTDDYNINKKCFSLKARVSDIDDLLIEEYMNMQRSSHWF